jgi:hypothetical protein
MSQSVANTSGVGVVNPTADHCLCGGAVRTLVFGRPFDYAKLPANRHAQEVVAYWAGQLGVTDVFVPRPVLSNAKVVDPLRDPFPETASVDGFSTTFHLGMDVDGVVLRPGTALFIASADCPTFVARSSDGLVVAAHAGRGSLIDEAYHVQGGGFQRRHESVVFAALRHLKGGIPAKARTALVCGIGPKDFKHPVGADEAGRDNARRVAIVRKLWGDSCLVPPEFLCRLNLFEIVKAQLKRERYPSDCDSFFHDRSDTHNDRGSDGYKFHSFRRDKSKARNGILVAYLP